MHSVLATLIDRLDSSAISGAGVISWGCPVPSFGDPLSSTVATLGLNPSNREFVDEMGNELEGASRRFHSLRSLGIGSWAEVDARHLHMIIESCRRYFFVNPYDRWFKILDQVVSGAAASYYDKTSMACHLDLIPYATVCKWTDLTIQQRSVLFDVTGDILGFLLRDSPITTLILNGRSVVGVFQEMAAISLNSQKIPEWSLPRHAKPDVPGVAYWGTTDTLAGVGLNRKILILGYNHNLQSSFGVTAGVILAIRNWIFEVSKEVLG